MINYMDLINTGQTQKAWVHVSKKHSLLQLCVSNLYLTNCLLCTNAQVNNTLQYTQNDGLEADCVTMVKM